MKMDSLQILKKVVDEQSLYEILRRPRNRTISVDKSGGFKIFDLHDADYMQQFYKNKIDIPDRVMRNQVVLGDCIKLHANWAQGEDEVFWVRVSLVDILPAGEKIFYAVTEYSTDQLVEGAVIGPICISNICDMDLENGFYTDGYQVAEFKNGENNV